jgi:hypothetical protein
VRGVAGQEASASEEEDMEAKANAIGSEKPSGGNDGSDGGGIVAPRCWGWLYGYCACDEWEMGSAKSRGDSGGRWSMWSLPCSDAPLPKYGSVRACGV